MGTNERRGFIDYFMKMNTTTWLSLAVAVLSFASPASTHEPRVVCYYTNWSVYRPGTAKFNPQNINPYLCTHLIYAFGGFTKENTLKPFDKYQDIEKGGYAKFTGLKTYNKELKTLLAIGGWNEGSSRFSPMVASRERRKEFVRNAIKFLRQNRFDGLDLDWEYPAFRDGSKPKDREHYAKLVKELREEFERESEKTGRPRLLLTMAVPAGIEYIQKGFDVKTLNQYLDWMNLLTYDYHSAFEPAVNHHAPLYPLEEPNEYSVDNDLNIDYTIKFYLENGADRSKLVLGIPTYGRSYTLFNADATEIGAPADGPGEQGDATREKGYLAYYEICEALKPKEIKKRAVSSDEDEDEDEDSEEDSSEDDEPWTVVQPNPAATGPFAYKGNQWVGYDDIDIVKKKAEYVAENGLGGIMFWSIDNDDFRGNCHGKPYPLIEAAKEAYIANVGTASNAVTERPVTRGNRRNGRPRTTTARSTTTKSTKRKSALSSTTPAWTNTPEPPTTPDPGSDFKCTDEGFFQHPRDCKKYFWCLDSGPSNLGIVAHQFTCPSGLFFNKAADSCDFSRNVLCKTPAATTKAPTTSRPVTTTTTRKPVKLSTKNSALFRTTTTTTTPEPEVEEEYEDEIGDAVDIEAEDPKVIKELIDLIKKVGGVEQLEKQLHLSESSPGATTTAAPFNKRLYQKVLERTRGKTKASNSVQGSDQNSRRGPQNAGLAAAADRDRQLKKDRPQYTTIQRTRPIASTSDPLDDEDSQEDVQIAPQSIREEPSRVATTTKPLQYVNIRRARPTSDTADDSASRNALFERPESVVAVSEVNSLALSGSRRETPEYVTIRRQRPVEEATTAQYQSAEQEEDNQGTALEREISSPPQPQYTSIIRGRSSTPPPEEVSSPEPTTVLDVQIASLLNSGSSSEVDDTETTIAEATEADVSTTTSTTTTTSSTTTAAPTSTRTLRPGLRRRGSTTAPPGTTTTTASTNQVSSRNYTFVRRRRPLSQPNEIVSDSDDEDVSRKIRSTTPDSIEVEGFRPREFPSRRSKVRFQSQAEDSVPAAASPVSRGQYRPQLSRDEVQSLTPIDFETPQEVQRPSFTPRLDRRFRPRTSTVADINIENEGGLSLTPIDVEPPQFVPRGFTSKNDRRFSGRTSTVADSAADSEASAATVEGVRRPTLLPRGRNRFTPSSTTISLDSVLSTESPNQKRPTFARFSPRPFATRSSTSTPEEKEDQETDAAVSRVLPTRLPFGRTRPSTQQPSSTASPSLLPRRLPFSSRLSTTQQTETADHDDEESEEKTDDISLSESAIAEKEHDEQSIDEAEEQPKRRIVIKKLRTPSSSTTESTISTESIPITDDNGRKKIKVIRRRPSSTTETVETSSVSTEAPSPTPQRVRKIIRKKIIPLEIEDEPEIIAKSIGSLNTAKETTTEIIVNYGEKNKPATSTTVAEDIPEKESLDSVKDEEIKTTNENENKEDTQTAEVVPTKEEEKESSAEKIDNVQDIKPEVSIETEQKAIDLSENKKEPETDDASEEVEESKLETTSPSTTRQTSLPTRSRSPYRPSRRQFTSTTEATPSSTRSFSRKFNLGAYTSPATVDKVSETAIKASTRRPLYSSRTFTRRPFTTARTTKKIEEQEEEEYSDEEIEDEEENPLVLVPPSQLFTRRPIPDRQPEEEYEDESDEVADEEQEDDQPQNRFTPSTRKPTFKPRVVNSNTFRTSTSTTELPSLGRSQNKTAIYNRFGGNKPVNDTKKRVQNVPVAYSSPTPTLNTTSEDPKVPTTEKEQEDSTTTTTETDGLETTTEDDDYLTMPETSTISGSTDEDATSTNTVDNETVTTEVGWMEIDNSTDDYLEFSEGTTNLPTTQDATTSGQTENSSEDNKSTDAETETEITTTEHLPETTTTTTTTTTTKAPEPKVKTQFNKLFSVSRSVEVNSKLDKHRLNKNNETRLIEEGQIMVEKKPQLDKIGEVSRFSLIKIVEDEIPIYLTKLGHVYPVENPPDHFIRIDEARNARALVNFADAPRENLIASESMNEAYRHVNKVANQSKEDSMSKGQVEHVISDDFLSYVNVDKKSDKSEEDFRPWQFVPAAYENEKNKAAKKFEVITPRSMLTEPSTLPLEALFKTENPIARNVGDINRENQPFVVYSASVPNQKEEANIVQLDVLNAESVGQKPESGRSIITFAKGHEFNGASVTEESTVKYPIFISIVPKTSESTFVDITEASSTTEAVKTSPLIELLTTTSTTMKTELPSTSPMTTEVVTTETVTEEATTVKASLFDTKRKFAFPRRNILKPNITRPSPAPRTTKKLNATVTSNLLQKANKTSGFNPNKSRFTANRSQNVPIDSRKKSTTKLPKTFSTESPRTTTERKLYFKPIRPIGNRPSFIPRRNTTPPPTQAGDT